MKSEERIWWEELADQYEEWAENPPYTEQGDEEYTCFAMRRSEFGWNSLSPVGDMWLLWCWQYADSELPAGFARAPGRPNKRFEFCHYMAETIREYLDTGRGAWEVSDE